MFDAKIIKRSVLLCLLLLREVADMKIGGYLVPFLWNQVSPDF
ncbi:hypothetical protein NQ095_18780 [Rossellomorea sp. SC111]|nr:hypothetical protein [Rossellomorea sp. SC111]MCR8850467.1 hypothetical protein [Rossellomorea sp. SC111]